MIAVPIVETLPVRADTAQWPVWGTTARLVVTDPAAIPAAEALVRAELDAVELACSPYREDSELRRLESYVRRPVTVSPLLAELIRAALSAAGDSDGDVDPTVGDALATLGYYGSTPTVTVTAAPGWRRVRLVGRDLDLPPGVRLDLGATAKAYTADRCAAAVYERLGVGVLVSLGGDIATAGPAPASGWQVLVQDGPGEPAARITLATGTGLATSSTTSRQWSAGARTLHHILDPRTCRPAPRTWRTASVAAATALLANTMSTAAIVRGPAAPQWLRGRGAPARLVGADGTVVTLGGWPALAEEK